MEGQTGTARAGKEGNNPEDSPGAGVRAGHVLSNLGRGGCQFWHRGWFRWCPAMRASWQEAKRDVATTICLLIVVYGASYQAECGRNRLVSKQDRFFVYFIS